MEIIEDILIVGAGIAGLSTSLGLHRLGLRSLVLESSDSLRIKGFAFVTWTNAWRALDAIGVGDSIRQEHLLLNGLRVSSTVSGLPTSAISFGTKGKFENHEVRCVKRKVLLETLEKELPRGTIRYSSKVVAIEESGGFKIVHLADGSFIKTKVLIGCDGVNSVVARWLGLKKPVHSGRSAIRALAEFPDGHGFDPIFSQNAGDGVRHGFIPCDEKTLYWFFTFTSSNQNDADIEDNPVKMKQFVMSKLGKVSQQIEAAVEKTELYSISSAPLTFRRPWEVIWGDIVKGNVCVAGDALHPMTPDIAQGACSALEDGVVLARCLGEALLTVQRGEIKEDGVEEEECMRIEKGLEKFAKERRWRSSVLISTAYFVGLIQQSGGKVISLLRENLLSGFMTWVLLKMSEFDCGKLTSS